MGCGCGEVGTVPEHQMKTQRKGTEKAGKPGPEVTEVRGGGGGGGRGVGHLSAKKGRTVSPCWL